MDVNTIMTLIGSLGFPIVACIALFYMNNKQEEQHKEEIGKITEALNNNTTALIKLSNKLGVDPDER